MRFLYCKKEVEWLLFAKFSDHLFSLKSFKCIFSVLFTKYLSFVWSKQKNVVYLFITAYIYFSMDNFIIDNSIRLVVALLLGGIVGMEREYRSKDAGFRTHFLVALGAALFTIVSVYGFGDDRNDTSRVAAQVVSGIGFLGAGIIVFQKNMVRGLTTAAGLWVTAAIGMACGVGMYGIAVIVTILILLGLEVFNKIVPQLSKTVLQLSFSTHSKESVNHVVEQIKNDGIEILSYELRTRRTTGGTLYEASLEIRVQTNEYNKRILEYINEFDDVNMISIE